MKCDHWLKTTLAADPLTDPQLTYPKWLDLYAQETGHPPHNPRSAFARTWLYLTDPVLAANPKTLTQITRTINISTLWLRALIAHTPDLDYHTTRAAWLPRYIHEHRHPPKNPQAAFSQLWKASGGPPHRPRRGRTQYRANRWLHDALRDDPTLDRQLAANTWTRLYIDQHGRPPKHPDSAFKSAWRAAGGPPSHPGRHSEPPTEHLNDLLDRCPQIRHSEALALWKQWYQRTHGYLPDDPVSHFNNVYYRLRKTATP